MPRVDLPAEAFDSELQGRGTTNVDFNSPMRAALGRLRDQDDARLAVGSDRVELSKGEDSVVEKKVKLPIRWIKGIQRGAALSADDAIEAGGVVPRMRGSSSAACRARECRSSHRL